MSLTHLAPDPFGSSTGRYLAGPGAGQPPAAVAMQVDSQSQTYRLEEIDLTAGDHVVYADGYAAVIGGTGNNTIYNAGFAYGGIGDSTIYNATHAYGGIGNARLIGYATGDGGLSVSGLRKSRRWRDRDAVGIAIADRIAANNSIWRTAA